MKLNLRVTCFFLLLNISIGLAQDGSVDLSFNQPVHPTAPTYNGFIGTVYATKMLSSGKILVYGELTQYMGNPVKNLVRLNPNGSVDTTFNAGTGPQLPTFFFESNSNLIGEQPDGKVILVGPFSTYNGIAKNRIVRLNLDGSIDSTFNIGSGFNGEVCAVDLQADGKILCGGYFTNYNGTAINHLARLNTDGTIDTTFNPGAGAVNSNTSEKGVYAIECQPNGKILVGGKFTGFNGVTKNGLIRLETNGAVDNTFQIGSGAAINDRILKIYYNTQTNKIFIAGRLESLNNTPTKNIVSLNTDGTFNNAFSPVTHVASGTITYGIRDFSLLSNGKVIVAGDFQVGTKYDLFMFNADGTDDTNFAFENAQASNNPEINSLSVDNSDGIFAAGYFQNVNGINNDKGSIVKIFSNGVTDIVFNPNLGAVAGNGSGANALLLSNGKILIKVSVMYNERDCNSITINQDGSIYQTDFSNYLNLNLSNTVSIKSNDNKAFIGGGFVYKINNNGTLDNTFASTSNLYTLPVFNVSTYDLEQQSDNKLIIAGWFRLANTYYQDIARLNTNGTVDASFAVGNGFTDYDSHVRDVVIQPDNKIVAVGKFVKYNGSLNLSNIARINSDGSLDNTFVTGTGFNHWVRKVIMSSDNKLLVCGRFTEYNGVVSPYIVKLNLNGSVDTSFTSPFAVGDFFSDSDNIVLQPNGKILMSIYYNETQKLYRLNTDGSIDTTFNDIVFTDTSGLNCSPSTYDKISSITLLQNKILLTGCFNYLNGYRRVGIAMLNDSESTLTIEENEFSRDNIVSIAPNPVESMLILNSDNSFNSIEIYSLDGKKILSEPLIENSINLERLKAGIYIARVANENFVKNIKFVKK